MELISVRELFKNTAAYAGKTVEVGGWVRNRRPSKQFGFIVPHAHPLGNIKHDGREWNKKFSHPIRTGE